MHLFIFGSHRCWVACIHLTVFLFCIHKAKASELARRYLLMCEKNTHKCSILVWSNIPNVWMCTHKSALLRCTTWGGCTLHRWLRQRFLKNDFKPWSRTGECENIPISITKEKTRRLWQERDHVGRRGLGQSTGRVNYEWSSRNYLTLELFPRILRQKVTSLFLPGDYCTVLNEIH